MNLSLSARIAELEHIKDQPAVGFEELAQLASEIGYEALCIRSAQVTLDTPDDDIEQARQVLDHYGLQASMVCPGAGVSANTADSSQALRNIGRHLDVTGLLGSKLLRVSVMREDDVIWAQRAADQARERGIRLVQMTHTECPFETVDDCLEMLTRIDRPDDFGLCVEPANLLVCGDDYGPDALRRISPHIFNVYVQNVRIDETGSSSVVTNAGIVRYQRLIVGEETPEAQAGVDFDRFFEGLKSIQYAGFVTCHQPLVEGTSVSELAQFVYDHLIRSLG